MIWQIQLGYYGSSWAAYSYFWNNGKMEKTLIKRFETKDEGIAWIKERTQ